MRAVIIGAGFSGLATGSLLLKEGWDVTIVERNAQIGGRARLHQVKGYAFDMGPSWYLMPEVFERFFSLFGKRREDYYALKRLNPQYRVFFEEEGAIDITADRESNLRLFESFEPGGAKALEAFLADARYKYETAMRKFIYRTYSHIGQFFNVQMLTEGLKLDLFTSLSRHVGKYFKDHRAHKILEYTTVFLGTAPHQAPALYSIMSHVDLDLGVYFPSGGLNGVARALARLFQELGGRFILKADVTSILIDRGQARGVKTVDGEIEADVVVNCGDYAWGETRLLPPEYQTYPEGYWARRVVAPSMFLLYVGVKRRLTTVEHHNLYFSRDWKRHFDQIFEAPAWPENPCFYLSAISRTEPQMAPPGSENVFILVPVASGLEDDEFFRERYAEDVLAHVERVLGEKFRADIEVLEVFGPSDFAQDYHAYRGTALGLSHTLFQTAVFRPSYRSKKVKNLFYAGQYTHPGVGVPMALIAAELTVGEVLKRCRPKSR